MPCFNSHTRKAAIRSLLSRITESAGCSEGSIAGGAGNCRGRFNPRVVFLRGERQEGRRTTLRFSLRIKNRSALQDLLGIFASLVFGQNAAFNILPRAGWQQLLLRNGFVTNPDDAWGMWEEPLRPDLRRAKAAPTFRESASGHNAKPLQQLLTHFHRDLRGQPAQHFVALRGIHGCEGPDKIVATLHFGIATPTQAERQQSGRSPNRQISLLDHLPR